MTAVRQVEVRNYQVFFFKILKKYFHELLPKPNFQRSRGMLHGKTVEEQRALREAAMSRTTKTIIILSVVFLVCNVTFAGKLFGYKVQYGIFAGKGLEFQLQSETLLSTICFKVADIVRDNQAKNSKYGQK